MHGLDMYESNEPNFDNSTPRSSFTAPTIESKTVLTIRPAAALVNSWVVATSLMSSVRVNGALSPGEVEVAVVETEAVPEAFVGQPLGMKVEAA